jgi:large subunit ribosomal protein L17
MRHGIAGKKFQRNSAWRYATVRDMAKATLIHERICTTKVRAKEARKLVDHLITLGKKGSLSARRRAYAILCHHSLVADLFNKVALRFKKRNGGYTRIIPLAHRRGDNAKLVYLELTEKSEVVLSKPKTSAAKKAKELTAVPEEQQIETDTRKDEAAEEKKSAPPEKVQHKKDHLGPEVKGKGPKPMMGGLQKMFRRKVGE